MRLRVAASMQAASTRRTPCTPSRTAAGPREPTASTTLDCDGVVISASVAAEDASCEVAGTSSERSAPPDCTSCGDLRRRHAAAHRDVVDVGACRSGSLPGLQDGLRDRAYVSPACGGDEPVGPVADEV